MDWGKGLFLFPYTYTPLVVLWASYHTCDIIRDINLWFQNVAKIKFVLWQPGYYNLLTEKKDIRKFTLLKCSFSWKRTFTVNLKTFSSNTIFRWYTFSNFISSNSIILVEDLIKWKRCFEIFLIDYCAGDIGNKNIAGKY